MSQGQMSEIIALNTFASNLAGEPSFFKDTFFKNTKMLRTTKIDLDQLDIRSTKLAPLTLSSSSSTVVEKDKFLTTTFNAPYTNQSSILTPDDLGLRSIGQSPFATDNMNLFDQKLFEITAAHECRRLRRIEALSAQAIVNGKMIIKGNDVNDIINFNRHPDLTLQLTSAQYWNDPASSPLTNLRQMRKTIAQKSGFKANVVTCGAAAAAAFINHEEVKKYISSNGLAVSRYLGERKDDGSIFLFNLPEFGDFYTHEAGYTDDTGAQQNYIDDWSVSYASSDCGVLVYGAISNMIAGGLVSLEKFVFTKYNDEGKGGAVVMESAPCPIPVANATALIHAVAKTA